MLKSKISISIIILLILNKTYAQTYEPVVDTNKMWVIYEYCSVCHPDSGHTIAYKISHDSVFIDNEYWYRILVSDDSSYSEWSFFDYNGYIREENKIVLNKSGIYVDTLYNFNLGPGDTCFSPNGFYIIEDTITTFFAGKNRKAQVLDFRSDTIYTGIGSKQGGLLVNQYYFTTGAFQSLICFYENNSLLYHNPDYESCYIDNITSAGKLWAENIISIYPNPVNDKIFIESRISANFVLYNLNGKKVLSKNLKPGTNIIQINFLNPSIYLCKILSKEGIMSYKLLKVKK